MVVGVLGDDEGGRMLIRSLADAGMDVSGLVVDKSRPTTRKTRIWASHRQQVVRVDRESTRKVSPDVVGQVLFHIDRLASQADAIVISDYDKGVITSEIASAAILAASARGKVSISNPKPRNLACFTGVYAMTLNQSEAVAGSGVEIHGAHDVERAGRKLLGEVGCQCLVVTRGSHGLTVFEAGGAARHISAVESEVYDVAGAGGYRRQRARPGAFGGARSRERGADRQLCRRGGRP